MGCAIVLNMKTSVTAELCKIARKRLLQMHYESGVGHIGGNLSALDALLLIVHEYLNSADRFIYRKDMLQAHSILHFGLRVYCLMRI